MKIESDKITYNDKTTLMHKDRSLDLREYWHNAIADLVTTGKVSKENPLSSPVNGLWKKVVTDKYDPVRSLRWVQDNIEKTSEYLEQGKDKDTDYIAYNISKKLFTWQKDLLEDDATKVTLNCGRRSGKSYVLAAKAVRHCLKGYDEVTDIETQQKTLKKRYVLIMGLTHSRTAEVFWQNVCDFADVTGMVARKDNSSHKIEFTNGAIIQLWGNASKAEREKLRGAEYSLIIIDEAQSQQSLSYLMRDILGPIAQGRQSSFILAGTGSISEKSYWKDITESPTWRHYQYTMMDNPTIPDRENALKQVLIDNGWDDDNPTYQREYLGRNVIDTERVVIPKRHYIEDYTDPFTAIACVIGVDYGVQDYNALVPILKDAQGNMRIVDEVKFNKASASEIVDRMAELERFIKEKYKCSVEFVADTSDQAISKDLRRKGARIHNAFKTDRKLQLSELAYACRTGKLLCSRDGEFEDECKQAIWDFDIEKNEIVYEFDDSYHPDALMAASYCYHYLTTGKYSRSEFLD